MRKKKIIRIIIFAIITLICISIIRTTFLYFGNYIPNKVYFGDEYKQIIYPTSIPDYFVAKKVLKEADKALSTITTYEDSREKFGELGYLCITGDDTVKEKHKLRFIAANLSKDEGYIWVKYSTETYDKNGKVTGGSWGVLSKWKLEKKDDKWIVISVKEHP